MNSAPDFFYLQNKKYSFETSDAKISAIFHEGKKPAVLLLHGNSSCKEIFCAQSEYLVDRGYSIVVPDLPGHGESGKAKTPASTYSFPGYASLISELLDQLGISACHVVGWSLGGHIGLELLGFDERVRSLLIAGTPPAKPSPEAIKTAFYQNEKMDLAGKRDFSHQDAVTYGTAMLGGSEFLFPFLFDKIVSTDGAARYHMSANAMRGLGADQRQVVEWSTTPLCVVHGRRDPFVRLDYLNSLSYKNLWSGRIMIIENAGHAPHFQHSRHFNQILSRFILNRIE